MPGERVVESGDFVIVLPKDIKDVEAWKGGDSVKLPPGTYDLEIVKMSKSRAEGNIADVLNIIYKVVGGEFDGQTTFPDKLSLSEQAEGKFKQLVEAVSEGKIKAGSKFKSGSFLGKRLSARVFNETYNNEERNKFADYRIFGANGASGAASASPSAPKSAGAVAEDQAVESF